MTSAVAPLGSPAFFTPAIYNLQNTSEELSRSTLRLSSGNRITRVAEDVAAFSVASRLQGQLSSLKQATQNVAQGGSMMQVAEGGLSQIITILDKMKTTAIQANSSSLTDTDRSFLQQQFTQYLEAIDNISDNTTFNNIKLLDGTLSGANKAQTTTTAATKASGTLTFTVNPSGGQTVVINGVTFTAGTDFTVGGTTAATVTNLATALNSSTNTALSKASYQAGGNTLTVTARAGGTQGNQFTINQGTSTTTFTTGGASTNAANVYTLTGGLDNGLALGGSKVTGTVGDALVNTQSQTAGSVTLTISGAVSNGELLRIDNGNGGYVDFTFATTASTSTDIQIGASTEETLQNAVDTLTQYSATSDYGVRQLEYSINGNSLVIRNRLPGNPTDLSAATLDIAETLTNGSLSAATITGGTNTGVNASGITNSSFLGTIGGFTATYNSSDNITASITVGSSTYSATISDTTPGSNTTVRFTSTSGGYFDVQLASGQGSTVSNQSGADTFADRLDAAFSTLEFHQERPVSTLEATGQFIGASAKIQLSDFSDIRINSIEVTAPASPGTDATIDVTINNKVFRATSGLGGSIGERETIKFYNLEDGNEYLSFTNGTTVHDFSTANNAADFEADLRDAFGLNSEGTGVTFQIGATPEDLLTVVVDAASTSQLFNGVTPSVSTQNNAATAEDAIDTARDAVQRLITSVGALQDRFTIASNVLDSTTLGITAANSNLADTDIVAESTNFATQTLKINAGIAVLAQARNLQSNLLGLLQSIK